MWKLFSEIHFLNFLVESSPRYCQRTYVSSPIFPHICFRYQSSLLARMTIFSSKTISCLASVFFSSMNTTVPSITMFNDFLYLRRSMSEILSMKKSIDQNPWMMTKSHYRQGKIGISIYFSLLQKIARHVHEWIHFDGSLYAIWPPY